MREQDNQFLALFPHRYDYIYAPFPESGCKPNWHTESRHPLSDRIIQQGGYLYGVRFGSTTSYTLLDIDTTGPYHPRQDPFAVSRIMAALEPLGLVRAVICTSSDSGGLHLYLPFKQALPSWKVARVMAHTLQQAGFKLYPGQLELFPNPKSYNRAGKPTLYHAHRLPLQIGSYLLNADLQTTWSSPDIFVRQWCSASQANTLDTRTLTRYLKQTWQGFQPISSGAKKFVQDLNAEIEAGWSDYGQTNRLLGRIAMRTYIFHHILHGGEPLTGHALVNQIVAVAQSLPGYQDWCQHQHEIVQRAADWARSVEKSHYFHYGLHYKLHYEDLGSSSTSRNSAKPRSAWNQQQLDQTRTKIQHAVSDMQNSNQLPEQATARFKKLTQSYRISGSSLYRHRDLWHPEELKVKNQAEHLTQECNNTDKTKDLNDLVNSRTLENQWYKKHHKDIKGQNVKDQDMNLAIDLTSLVSQDVDLGFCRSQNPLLGLFSYNHLTNPHSHQHKEPERYGKFYTSLLDNLGCNARQRRVLTGFPLTQIGRFNGCNTYQDIVQRGLSQPATFTAVKFSSVGQVQPHEPLVSQLLPGEIARSHLERELLHLTTLPLSVLKILRQYLLNLIYGADGTLANHFGEQAQQLIELIYLTWSNLGETFPPNLIPLLES